MESPQSIERKALTVSLTGAIFMAALGFGFAIISSSGAIFLDGIFSLINFLMALFTLRIARKVVQPANNTFQFGYSQLEPLLNTIKGLLFFGTILMALFASIDTILKGGRIMKFDVAILYALIAASGCFVLAFCLKRANSKHPTPLLGVETKAWLIDGYLSGVVLLTFVLGFFLQKTRLEAYLSYLDPAIVILMCVIMISVPYKIIKENVFELLLSTPSNDVQEKIERIIDQEISQIKFDDYHVKMAKTGRVNYVHFIFLTSKNSPIDFDPLRKAIYFSGKKENLHLDLAFECTQDKEIFQALKESPTQES